MNANEIPVSRWRLMLVLAFILGSTGFGERALFAASPAPQVRFDQTVIPPDVPPQVLIGEDFTFRVRFRNVVSATAIAGFGPFIDVILDAGGANITKAPQTQPCPCDGITFLQASVIGVNGGPVPLVTHQNLATCASLPPKVSLSHPFAGVSPVVVPAGAQLVTIELPFGSFDPTQPEVVVEITAHVSKLADANVPFKISARGGFRYGATPVVDAPPDWPVVGDVIAAPPPADQQTDSTLWAAQAQTTPTVLTVSKNYLGPENETVTGPNFMRRYQITLDVATGQTVNNVKVTDHLPNNVAFHQMVSSSPPCFIVTASPAPNIAHNSPNNGLVLQCSSITGVAGPDATIVFEFFIPEFDANNNPVLPASSCAFVQSINDIKAEGSWVPIDACDITPVNVVSDVTSADHTLSDKCAAIQKTVLDLNGGPPAHPIPGDVLKYTVNFQLSDFKTAGNLKIQDILSDGQTLLPASLTLTVTDQCGTTSGAIPSSAWSRTTLSCPVGAPPASPPHTQLDFDVSTAMGILAASGGPPRHQAGILTGGFALATATSTVPATGTITFQAVIDDSYQCPVVPPHDAIVDKDDPMINTVTLTATMFGNGVSCLTRPNSTSVTANDDSGTVISVASDSVSKTVYAVTRGNTEICGPNTTPCPPRPEVLPFDLLTFRITKTVYSGDSESLTIQDWLPLPTFLAAGTGFNNVQCGIPAVGSSCLGPTNTPSAAPITSGSGTANTIKFDYGTFSSATNVPRTIDLLFTRTVTNTPSADGLYVSNQAQECESNSFGVTFCQTAIAQVQTREPALRISKGIVAASNPNAVFSPSSVGPVTFRAPGTSCPRFNGAITSADLASTPINSDITGVDANDCVTFAIVVENTGGSPAYDVKLREFFPLGPTDGPECFAPNFSTLCVTDGTGTAIPFTPGAGMSLPIALQNPLPGVNASGSNIAVLTFDACILGDIHPHCCDNIAAVENYASTVGGPNFVGTGFGGPYYDGARICVLPEATKSIKTTSEAHTPGTPSSSPLSPEKLAIGEIIRYRLEVVVPETTSPSSYKLKDFLPSGLSYLPGPTTTVTMSAGLSVSNSLPLIVAPSSCGGGNLTFDFGNVTNSNNTSAQEIIALEFNALVCNVASNQNGAALNNSFAVLVDGQQVTASNAVAATIVEPKITVSKSGAVPTLTVAAIATYTITLTNSGTATAFDVRLTDQLPVCLTNLANIQASTSATNSSSGPLLDLTITSIPVNGTVTVTYTATVSCIDCSKLLNTARATWTSLPGSLGTISNTTNSATPGATGQSTGERDGSGGVNDYAASATTDLCCNLVSSETISCEPGGLTYTFTVTNFSSTTATGVSFSSIAPSNVTVTPGSISFPPLPPGASTTVTVLINGRGAKAGRVVCFSVALLQSGTACKTDRCITLPNCCAQPPAGMVAWYPLDEQSFGVPINDIALPPSSTVNNVGTVIPPLAFPSCCVGSSDGRVNGALFFFGGFGLVEVPSQSDLNFSGGSFSIDAWINLTTQGPAPIVDKLDTSQNTGYVFYAEESLAGIAVLKLQVNSSTFTSSGSFSANSSPFLRLNWAHVAVTVDLGKGIGTFYINGLAAGNFTTSVGPSTNSVPMWIGRTRIPGFRNDFLIDELEIFNRALTPAEVKDLADANTQGKCYPPVCVRRPSGLIDWWQFDEVTGQTAQDAAGSVKNSGTYSGAPQPVVGLVGPALEFDGNNDSVQVSNEAEVNFPGCPLFNSVSEMTIDVWVHVNIPPGTSATSGLLTILDKRVDTIGGARGYHLFIFNGRAGFQIDGVNHVAPASGPNFIDVADGQWHFIAVSLRLCPNGGGFLFVDGRNVATLPGASDFVNSGSLFIGARDPAFGANFFHGALDELEFFRRALSEDELFAIFAARELGKCKISCAGKAISIAATVPQLVQGQTVQISSPFLVAATGGAIPYQYSVTAGALPPGMLLDTFGRLFGTAPAAGTYNFTITAIDADGCRAQRDVQLIIGTGKQRAVRHQ